MSTNTYKNGVKFTVTLAQGGFYLDSSGCSNIKNDCTATENTAGCRNITALSPAVTCSLVAVTGGNSVSFTATYTGELKNTDWTRFKFKVVNPTTYTADKADISVFLSSPTANVYYYYEDSTTDLSNKFSVG